MIVVSKSLIQNEYKTLILGIKNHLNKEQISEIYKQSDKIIDVQKLIWNVEPYQYQDSFWEDDF